MSALSSYTPLESLLLFQSLRVHGLEPLTFSKISESLKNNPLIRDDKGYDDGRLSPDSLRELYLALLKEEVRNDLQNATTQENEYANGDTPVTGQKRKVPSPKLPTVQEAAKHAHLLPKLVDRLYIRYREQTIREIREEERRYDALNREVEEIEQGKWDDRIQRRDTAPAGTADGQHKISPPTQITTLPTPVRAVGGPDVDGPELRRPPTQPPKPVEPRAPLDTVPYGSPNTEAFNSVPRTTVPGIQELVSHRRSTSAHEAQNGLPHGLPSPTIPRPSSSHQLLQAHRLPPPQPSGPGYRLNSPSAHQSPYAPAHSPVLPPPSAGAQYEVPNAHRGSPILPPPPGMQLPPPNGIPPPQIPPPLRDVTPYRGSPQAYGPPAGHHSPGPPPGQYLPPPNGRPPPHFPQPSHLPQQQPPPPPTQRGPYSPYQSRPPVYQPPQQPPPPQQYYPPHQGGYMLPPFQVTPQDPSRTYPQTGPQHSPATPSRASIPPSASLAQRLPPIPADRPPLSSLPQTPVPHPQLSAVARASFDGRVQRQSSASTPGSITRWKPVDPAIAKVARSPERPRAGSLSPILARAPTPPRRQPATEPRVKSRPLQALQGPHSQKPPAGAPTIVTPTVPRGRGRPRKTTETDGAVALTVEGATKRRTRSRSIISPSPATVLNVDQPPARDVKAEPRTPADAFEEPSIGPEAASDAGVVTRRRANTLQSSQPLKRKRSIREGSEVEEPPEMLPVTPSANSNMILCTRNFARISAPLMNDIQSHKYASFFSNPVKNKDAQGYHDIIRRPQDLKSIRAAIAAGSRAVQAAAAETPLDSPSASGTSALGGAILLPKSADLMPPKGIVNSAQLERELMRMFANAIMFNAGDTGFVQDTRSMYEDVQRSVDNWRGAERATLSKLSISMATLSRTGTLGSQVDETPSREVEREGDGEETPGGGEEQGPKKRRIA